MSLWQLGTLPPRLIAFHGHVHIIDPFWHMLGLGYQENTNVVDVENVGVIHFNGRAKPWLEKSIFIKPNTFHLTVLMLKLWNKDRVKTATESISSKVMEALDNRLVSIGLKGLECMKGSMAKLTLSH